MKFNYQKICQDLLSNLPPKQKGVILRRFGLDAEASGKGGARREILESIGRSLGVTRERVRQIEAEGLESIRPKSKKYGEVFQSFRKYFQQKGGVREEETMFDELGEGRWQNQVYLLLVLAGEFLRFGENRDFWSSWAVSEDALNSAKKEINTLYCKLQESGKPSTIKTLLSLSSLGPQALESYLGISKKIQKNSDNLYGLKNWPEINPRGIKDKAFLVFKKEQKPLHFGRVAQLIEGSLVQTVHNELIRDPRFVLVGRGMYALKDWGYEPGQVKDVISKTLKEENKPLTKEEILERVLRQRLVKANTVFLNLGNKKYFSKDSQGKYWVTEEDKSSSSPLTGVRVREA
ncbi:MAG: sigma factor-like helix-turn-helix DNA-binding protein [Candidatus Wildermuthbacteria bacterium]|nr:sigma factor-like helix-turn-helix DNA-binding protein [Candidatus Wildermuthbacteria bacterium]